MQTIEAFKKKLEMIHGKSSPIYGVVTNLIQIASNEQLQKLESICVNSNYLFDPKIKGVTIFEVRSHKGENGSYIVAAKSKQAAADAIGCTLTHLKQYGSEIKPNQLFIEVYIKAYNKPKSVHFIESHFDRF